METQKQRELVASLERRLVEAKEKLLAMEQGFHLIRTSTMGNDEFQQREPVASLEQRLVQERAKLQAMEHGLDLPRTVTHEKSYLLLDNSSGNNFYPSMASTSTVLQAYYSTKTGGREQRNPTELEKELAMSVDLVKNKEFYRGRKEKPLYSSIALIRQAILESPERQLTLKQIYAWIEDTFGYYRSDQRRWRDDFRREISSCGCFAKVKDGKKTLWTFIDNRAGQSQPENSQSTTEQGNSNQFRGGSRLLG